MSGAVSILLESTASRGVLRADERRNMHIGCIEIDGSPALVVRVDEDLAAVLPERYSDVESLLREPEDRWRARGRPGAAGR